MRKYIFTLFILIITFNFTTTNKNTTVIPSPRLDPMNWNNIVQDEDFIIKALQKLQVDLDITTSTVVVHVTQGGKIGKEKSRKLVDILINGTIEELQKVSRRKVLKVLPILDNIKVNLQKKLILWDILKNNNKINSFTINEIKLFQPLFQIIPEHELYMMNVMHEEVLLYLGSLSTLTRRKAAILAYALKNRLKKTSSELLHVNMINLMRGILCGFPAYDLGKLNASDVWYIDDEVFNNLWACTDDQLSVLWQLCKSNFQFAYVEMWNTEVIKKIGFVLKSVPPNDIKLIKPDLLSHVRERIFQQLTHAQLISLNRIQIKHLSNEQLVIYNAKT